VAVAKKVKNFVIGGGFMFAMCSATIVLILLWQQTELTYVNPCLIAMKVKPIINRK
jgi:hypothetical protein